MSEQPNILIIWGDDIGLTNLSCYSDGLMGYRTPNIDRIAAEGVRFTDYYGEQSCTAGRAAFITGQNPYRTGLTKVGMPGADIGLRAEDPTIATALRAVGYRTGQFGKNHLGDRDEFLPTGPPRAGLIAGDAIAELGRNRSVVGPPGRVGTHPAEGDGTGSSMVFIRSLVSGPVSSTRCVPSSLRQEWITPRGPNFSRKWGNSSSLG